MQFSLFSLLFCIWITPDTQGLIIFRATYFLFTALYIVLLNWKHWFQSPWSMRSGNESSSRVLGNISSVSLLGVWLVVRISVGSAPDQSEAFGAGEARPHEALAYALQYGLLWQQMVLMFDVTLLGLLNVESCCTVLYRTVLCHTATLHCYTFILPKIVY